MLPQTCTHPHKGTRSPPVKLNLKGKQCTIDPLLKENLGIQGKLPIRTSWQATEIELGSTADFFGPLYNLTVCEIAPEEHHSVCAQVVAFLSQRLMLCSGRQLCGHYNVLSCAYDILDLKGE